MYVTELVRRRPLVTLSSGLLALGLLAAAAAGCSKEPDKGQKGDDCEVNKDCESPLLCRNNTCVEGTGGDTGTDADGGTDVGDAADTDDGLDAEPEDYYISYLMRDQAGSDPGQLRVYSTADQSHTRVSPDSISCFSNCWLTRDMNHFVYTENAGGDKVDVMVAQVDDELKAEGTGSPLVEEVRDVSVEGDHVTYLRPGASGGTAFFRTIPDGEEKHVGDIGQEGDWFVEPESDIGVVYQVGGSAQSMAIRVGTATEPPGDGGFELGGPNFQQESGSYFGGNIMTAASRDGQLLAFATTGAPNDYGYCTRQQSNDAWSSEECDTSNVFKCGTEQRCTRLEVTVHIIDTEATDELGQQCDGPNDCSDYHECYTPSPSRQDEAMCIPGRAVVGVPKTDQGPNRSTSGCQTVKQDDSIDYTGINGPLTFDGDHNVYMVGTRDQSCLGDDGTPSSKIIRVDAETRDYTAVEGLGVDETFEGGQCWDSEENDIDIENCQVYVDSARISPGGNELAYSATNPLTMVGEQSSVITQNLFVWHVLKDGSDRWYTGDGEENVRTSKEVRSLQVHPVD